MSIIQSFVQSTPAYVERELNKADVNNSGRLTDNEIANLADDLQDSFNRFLKLTGSRSTRRFKEFYTTYVAVAADINPYQLPKDLEDNWNNYLSAYRARQPIAANFDGLNEKISDLVQGSYSLYLEPGELEEFGFEVETGDETLLPAHLDDLYQDRLGDAEDDEFGKGYVVDDSIIAKVFAGSELIGYVITIRTSDPEYGESGQNYLIVADEAGNVYTDDSEDWAY